MVLGRDVYQAIVQVLGKDAGELFLKAVEKALTELEEEIKNQKHTLKAQLKDELTKELITKEEFYGKIEVLYEHIERVKEEILRYVDAKFALLMQEIERVRNEAKQGIESVRSELRQEAERIRSEAKEDNVRLGEVLRKEMAELEKRLRQEMADLEKRLMQEIRRVETELRAEIEAIKERLFILEKRFDRLELYMRVLLVLVLLGLTLLNPTFFEIVKTIFGLK